MENLTIEPKKKSTGNKKTFSFRLPVDLIADIDQLAAQTNRNRSELVTLFLEFVVSKVEVKGK